jgi:hypothetical protein
MMKEKVRKAIAAHWEVMKEMKLLDWFGAYDNFSLEELRLRQLEAGEEK